MEENFEKPKKKILPLIIIVAIILVLAIGAVAYRLITSSPKRLINSMIDKAFALVQTKNDIKTEKSSFVLSANIQTKDEELKKILETYKINSSKITLNTEMDAGQKYIKANVIANYDGDEIANADAIVQDSDIYLFAEEFFNKYVKIPTEYLKNNGFDPKIIEQAFETTNKVSVQKNNELLDEIKKAIKDFLNDKKFEKENTELELDDKNVKVVKSLVTLTEKESAKLVINILEVLKNNEYFISLYKGTEQDITKTINGTIENLKDTLEENNSKSTIEFAIYTKGLLNEIVKVEAIVINESSEECYGISYTIENKNEAVVKISANEYSTKKSELEEMASVQISKEDKTVIYKLKIKDMDELDISVKLTEESENKGNLEITVTIPSDYTYDIFGEYFDDITATIKCDYEIDYEASISKENVKNSVEIEDLSEDDIAEIYENLQKSKLYEIIEKLIPTNNHDTDYDIDYDMDYDTDYDTDYDIDYDMDYDTDYDTDYDMDYEFNY